MQASLEDKSTKNVLSASFRSIMMSLAAYFGIGILGAYLYAGHTNISVLKNIGLERAASSIIL